MTLDSVKAGQALGLVEVMKMEIAFQAPVSGVVSEVLVRREPKYNLLDVATIKGTSAAGLGPRSDTFVPASGPMGRTNAMLFGQVAPEVVHPRAVISQTA